MNPVDVAVIGQGIVGKAIAFELIQAGLRVVTFEAGLPGSGSGAAQAINSIKGATSARDPLFQAKLAGHNIFDEWIESIRRGFGHHHKLNITKGSLEVFESESDFQTKIERSTHGEAFGLRRQEFLRASQIKHLLGKNHQILGAIHYPEDSSVSAQELMKCLEELISKAAPQYGSMKSASEYDRLWRVMDDQSTSCAKFVVIAAGPWTNDVLAKMSLPQLNLTTVPGETILLGLQQESKLSKLIISGKNNLTSTGTQLQFGSSSFNSETGRIEARVKIEHEARVLISRLGYDGINDSADVIALYGMRSRTKSRFPYVMPMRLDALESSVLVATGFYKNGYQLAPLAANSIRTYIVNRGRKDQFMQQSIDQNAT
jgi:glycine/D-amino acid oxidase-like deaminating enzyme